ncbi:MAG: hypothetical protein CMG57_05330 [Candidatus Marinimicrobia bacterium]|nr:hypothetical protein [Candidatus Neomarinimicrobiota bacterium]
MPEQIRKLAAIVFTDIVGFTKFSAENEPAALALLEKQREVLKPIVELHHGSWLKEMGDGLLLIFNTNLEAVNCAIAIQNAVKNIDDLNLRIGIHNGEVVFQGNDVVGDDVNIASRIEPFSASGGIAISDRVNASLERDPGFSTLYLGKPELKGVGQEVKVYCIISHGLPGTDLSQVAAKLEPEGFQWNVKNSIGVVASVIGLLFVINFLFLRIGYADEEEVPSIAILPFENKGAKEDDFYAYGISSDLITDVTGAGLIRVASLSDVEKLDYRNIENIEISKNLLVRYVAKGTLWKMDSIFQLTMEIFDTKSLEIIFNKRWQKDWKDLAVIKEDLSRNILSKINVVILGSGESKHYINPQAYEYYLKGKFQFSNAQSFEDAVVARELIQKAIDIDQNFSRANFMLGYTYLFYGEYEKAMDIFEPLSEKSKKINDKKIYASCLNAMGIINSYQFHSDTALIFYESSLKIKKEIGDKKGEAQLYNNIGAVYANKFDYQKSLDYMLKNLNIYKELDHKYGQAAVLNNIGSVYNDLGDYKSGLESCLRSIELKIELESPPYDFLWSYFTTSLLYADLEDFQNAYNMMEKSLKLQNDLKYEFLKDDSIIAFEYFKKMLGHEFNIELVSDLIKEKEHIKNTHSYLLYKLYDDKKYLEIAYNTIIDKSALLEDELKVKYLNYPEQKKVIEEWQKVQS